MEPVWAGTDGHSGQERHSGGGSDGQFRQGIGSGQGAKEGQSRQNGQCGQGGGGAHS